MVESFISPDPLTPETLQQALRHGLTPPTRAALLNALDTWPGLQQVSRVAPFTPLQPADREAAIARLDPLALALWRLLQAGQTRGQSDATTADLKGLRPHHQQAVRVVGRVPLGFARLIVEEARTQAVAGQEEVRWARRAIALIGGTARTATTDKAVMSDQAVITDLRLRARVYLADAFRMAGRHFEAEKVLAHVSAALATGTGDPELAATVHEIGADLLRVQGRPIAAVERLEMGNALLEDASHGARRAELLIATGNALVEAGRPRHAAVPLAEALPLLPGDTFPRLRLSALHNLAIAAWWAGDPHTASAHLATATPLYPAWGDPLIEAQRLRLLGSIYLESDRLDRAERLLRAARSRFLALGYGTESLRILLQLGRLYIRQGRMRELARLEGLLQGLITRPEPRRLVLAELRALRQAAAANGIVLNQLSRTIEALESHSPPTWVS